VNALSIAILCAAGVAVAGCQSTPTMPGFPLHELPRQDLKSGGCALFLWQAGPPPRLLAMVRATPPAARIAVGDGLVDLPRVEASGAPVRGVAPRARYGDGGRTLTIDLVIEERPDLADGAAVPSGLLGFEQEGADSMAVPVSGMIACR
jgi:hypothetical protein